ncbi:MAG: hypothetical protein EBV24_07200 [Actinobacteria bacterium]|nr:hypothetical protein [Actinomycetota bacterium]
MVLFPDSKELLELFLARDVRFLIVGGHALAAHGIPRGTDDFDLWVWADHGNALRITDALNIFGFGGVGLTPADLEAPDRIIQLGTRPCRIDLLTSITGVEFDDAWESRVEILLDGLIVPVISRTHLVINKWTTGRPQDLVDLMKLVRQAQRE